MVGYTPHSPFVKSEAEVTVAVPKWLGPAAVTLLMLVGIGVGVYMAGGARSLLTQLMYIPILLAAASLELPGGVIAALLASTIVGPLMPYNVVTDTGQSPSSWIYRSALFLVFGAVAGYLVHTFNHRAQEIEKGANRLSEVYTRVLSSLAMTVELRDEHARGHCKRVAHNAVAMGRELGFSEAQLETLHWGALLHDLGKISVPESILLKPGSLSEEEYTEIKRHPAYGADLLESVAAEFNAIARVVRYHHERWDGRGYPAALSGQEIPLMSRIVAVMDVFEALTSKRPYRQPMSPSRAVAYLKAESGSHFDPELIPLFERLYDQGEIHVAAEATAEPPVGLGHGAYRLTLQPVKLS